MNIINRLNTNSHISILRFNNIYLKNNIYRGFNVLIKYDFWFPCIISFSCALVPREKYFNVLVDIFSSQ